MLRIDQRVLAQSSIARFTWFFRSVIFGVFPGVGMGVGVGFGAGLGEGWLVLANL